MTGRVSLRLLLPLLLALPVLACSLVLVLVGEGHSRAAVMTLLSEEMVQIHGRVRERLDMLLHAPERISRINAELIRTGALDADRPRSWRSALYEQTGALEMLSGISWGDREGRVVWSFRYPGSGYEFGIKDEQTGDEVLEYAFNEDGSLGDRVGGYTYDPRVRPWYTGALDAGRPTFLEPYAWIHEDGSELTLGLPFVRAVAGDDGQTLGVLSTEIGLEDLSLFLRTLQVGESGFVFVFVLDARDRLLATSIDVPVVSQDQTLVSGLEARDPRITSVVRAMGDRKTGPFEAEGPEGRLLVRVESYRDAPGLDLRIVVGVPEAELLAPVLAGRTRGLMIIAAAIGVTVLLGIGLGVVMSLPVRRLVRDVDRVGAGELETEVGGHRIRELDGIASAINAMTVDLRDRVRLRESLLVAMDVQTNLLPETPPSIPGLDIAGHSTYCDETGGDYYDYLDVHGMSDHAAALVLGDVMGHGVAAAMLMATARGILRSRCDEPGSLGALLVHLNELLVPDTDGRRFMTMVLTVLDTESGTLTWASAGHDAPFLYRASEDRFVELDGGGIPLGILADQEYDEYREDSLQVGDVLMLATDGLWEATDASGAFYGKDRLKAVMKAHASEPAAQISEAIRADHNAFCIDQSQEDDITYVIARVVDR